MRIDRRLLLLLPVLMLGGCETAPVGGPAALTASLTRPGATLDRQLAADLVSQFRRGQGLGPLQVDPRLEALAEAQARSMAAAGKLSHDVGGKLTARLAKAGYRAGAAGENIAAGQDTLVEVFGDWRASPGHRGVMLTREATHIGVAAVPAPGSPYKIFWALIVAKPEG